MHTHLTFALIQTDIVWRNAEQNRMNLSKKIDAMEEIPDVIVFPEMFSTGFSMEPQEIAENMDGPTVQWMQEIAKQKNCALTGSLIILEGDSYYNRSLFVHPSGQIEFYDKRHLFSLAGEDTVYTAGKKKLIINYKGWKICPLICYDLRFPVWSRNTDSFDVLLYVANWPMPRIKAWDALLKARSIENMCYTIGVNRVGKDANGYAFSGHSGAFDSLGKKILETTPHQDKIAIVSIDKKHLTTTRKKLNFLNDQDAFDIIT